MSTETLEYTPTHRHEDAEVVHSITDVPPTPVVDTAEESQPFVLVATPCYGGMVSEVYLQSVLSLTAYATKNNIRVDFYTSAGESLVTRARNEAVATFLANEKYTHLMFIDADIGFTPNNFHRLLDVNRDVVAGVYPLKIVNWDNIVGRTIDNKTDQIAATIAAVVNATEQPDEQGFAKCLDAGTGFMLIKRGVFEKIAEHYPELRYTKDNFGEERTPVYAFFDTMIYEGRYLSEDYTFCRRWQNIGGEIWVDLQAGLLTHQGNFKYGKV